MIRESVLLSRQSVSSDPESVLELSGNVVDDFPSHPTEGTASIETREATDIPEASNPGATDASWQRFNDFGPIEDRDVTPSISRAPIL